MKYKLPFQAENIIKTLKDAGFQAYAVGGSVRDMLMEKKTKNWDFTTNAIPKEILKLFPDAFYDNVFGTVGISLEIKGEKEIYEITTYRTEHGYSDRRHPDIVKWGKTLEEDLARRDFTINAIAFDGQNLIDPYNGQEDIKQKIVRAVRNPNERFNEDALRMIRAIRITTELEFIIEEITFSAIKDNAHLIDEISAERVRDELIKILKSNHPADGIILLHNSNLLEKILRELEKGYGMAQAKHHKYDIFKHSIESLRHCPSEDWLVRFATLLHDVGKPITAKGEGPNRTFYNHEVIGAAIAKRITDRLHFPKKDREKLHTLVRWHQFTVDEFQTDKSIRRFIRRVGKENLKDIFDLRIGDRLGGGCITATSWRLRKFMQRTLDVQKHTPSVTDLKIDGHDIMRVLKIGSGPLVGQILKILFENVLEGKLKNEREVLLGKIGKIGNKLI